MSSFAWIPAKGVPGMHLLRKEASEEFPSDFLGYVSLYSCTQLRTPEDRWHVYRYHSVEREFFYVGAYGSDGEAREALEIITGVRLVKTEPEAVVTLPAGTVDVIPLVWKADPSQGR